MMRRRAFLRDAAKGAAGLSVAGMTAPTSGRGNPQGANDRVRVGLIGCGGRGCFVANHFAATPGVAIAAVCDVYEPNAEKARRRFDVSSSAHKDFRELLDRREIDAVLVATPDHWHAIPTVLACEAGKDVYVEKPLSHNIREGQAMVRAARRHHRIVQTGTQQRSARHFHEMRSVVQSGQLGAVHFVRIWNFRNIFPDGIGRKPDSEVPAGLDWDFYLGPAPKVPFNRNRFLYAFRWFWDYSGGVITDWGTHRFDSMHHVMGVDSPITIAAAGGRFALEDDSEIPDTLQVTYQYPGFVVSYEASVLNAHGCGGRTPGRAYYHAMALRDRPNGLALYGTNGALFADRLGYEIYPDLKPGQRVRPSEEGKDVSHRFRMQPRDASTPDSTAEHVANFIDCVRARSRPVADVEIGHRSAIVSHLGNIAYKTGHKLVWDADKEEIVDNHQASQLLGRQARTPWDLI